MGVDAKAKAVVKKPTVHPNTWVFFDGEFAQSGRIKGGAADLWWNDPRPQSEKLDPATGVAARGISRTIEFRSGSTRVVR